MKDKFEPGKSYRIERYNPNDNHHVKLSDWNKWTLWMAFMLVLLLVASIWKDKIDYFFGTIYGHALLVWIITACLVAFVMVIIQKLINRK